MKQSAGILVYKIEKGKPLVMLVHPGGPFWEKKDSWSIPKGELEEGEDLLEAALREFSEEVGIDLPDEGFTDLGESKQKGKINYIWFVGADLDLNKFHCTSLAQMEWPPHSGKQIEFPENDKAQWFELAKARQKLFKSLVIFIDRLAEYLETELPPEPEQQSLL